MGFFLLFFFSFCFLFIYLFIFFFLFPFFPFFLSFFLSFFLLFFTAGIGEFAQYTFACHGARVSSFPSLGTRLGIGKAWTKKLSHFQKPRTQQTVELPIRVLSFPKLSRTFGTAKLVPGSDPRCPCMARRRGMEGAGSFETSYVNLKC